MFWWTTIASFWALCVIITTRAAVDRGCSRGEWILNGFQFGPAAVFLIAFRSDAINGKTRPKGIVLIGAAELLCGLACYFVLAMQAGIFMVNGLAGLNLAVIQVIIIGTVSFYAGGHLVMLGTALLNLKKSVLFLSSMVAATLSFASFFIALGIARVAELRWYAVPFVIVSLLTLSAALYQNRREVKAVFE